LAIPELMMSSSILACFLNPYCFGANYTIFRLSHVVVK
jgi:hypothetical protein